MTVTDRRPAPPAARPQPAGPAPVPRSDAVRTLRVLLACALAILPLGALFVDKAWLVDGWATMAVVLGPVAVVRRWRPAGALQVWGGLALGALWLTAAFVPEHALGGLIPWSGTRQDVAALFDDLHRTTTGEVAPVHTTAATNFTLCAVLALLVALIDLLAVVGRHAALAGVPLLIVFTVSGAVPRQPVHWLLFVPAAIGFLLLLSVDADDEIRGWGRLMPRPGETRPRPRLAVSGQRIAVIAVSAAVLLPLVAPGDARNLIADAFHSGSGRGDSTDAGDAGFGGNGSVSLNPFVSLKGQLELPQPRDLFTVTVDPVPVADVFYVRTNVLSVFSGDGWRVGSRGDTESIGSTVFAVQPDGPLPVGDQFTARFEVKALGGNAPVLDRPISVSGLDGGVRWSGRDRILLGSDVRRGQTYSETVLQPRLTPQDLDAATGPYDAQLAGDLSVPAALPQRVRDLVARLTAGARTPYQRVRAVNDYFSPANGFSYSLQTKAGDSGSDLVDFLTNKAGFCQQFAASMAIMLRVAGVPARVVLGYTHPRPDDAGSFTVSTNDAHSWVEAYFTGIGWVPFDPTPPAAVGGSRGVLPYAPRASVQPSQAPSGSGSGATAANGKTAGVQRDETGPAAPAASGRTGGGTAPTLLAGLGVLALLLVVLAAVPGLTRRWRRRGRLAQARRGDPDPLWAELSATAVDLGYVWSPARTPRQIVDWLGPQARGAVGALEGLAAAVERSRYAPPTGGRAGSAVLVEHLRAVEASLRGRRPAGVRVRARLFPRSLGWPLPGAGARRR